MPVREVGSNLLALLYGRIRSLLDDPRLRQAMGLAPLEAELALIAA